MSRVSLFVVCVWLLEWNFTNTKSGHKNRLFQLIMTFLSLLLALASHYVIFSSKVHLSDRFSHLCNALLWIRSSPFSFIYFLSYTFSHLQIVYFISISMIYIYLCVFVNFVSWAYFSISVLFADVFSYLCLHLYFYLSYFLKQKTKSGR